MSDDRSAARILMTRDVECAACGYNLRGLAPEWACPECGTPVSRSVASPLIVAIDGVWGRRTARGVSMLSAGLGAWIATGLVLGAIGVGLAALIKGGVFTGWSGPMLLVKTVFGVGATAGLVLVVGGAWLATTAAPDLGGSGAVRSWRRGVRLCVVAVSMSAIGGLVLVMFVERIDLAWRLWIQVTDTWVLFTSLMALMLVAVCVGYVREVLMHVPDPGLGRRCLGRLRWLIQGVVVGLVGFGATAAAPMWVQVGAIAVCVFGAGLSLVGVSLLGVSLGTVGRRLSACAGGAPVGVVDRGAPAS